MVSLKRAWLTWLVGMGGLAVPAMLSVFWCSELIAPGVEPAAPDRDLATAELLLVGSELPDSWWVSAGPSRSTDDLSRIDPASRSDSWRIGFNTATGYDQPNAAQRVYRYSTSRQAASVYGNAVLAGQHHGERPSTWAFESAVADRSMFTCYEYGGQERLACEWSGLYEEYVVTLGIYVDLDGGPSDETIAQMEHTVRAIDFRMEQALARTRDGADMPCEVE
jgi:hypothetical protein